MEGCNWILRYLPSIQILTYKADQPTNDLSVRYPKESIALKRDFKKIKNKILEDTLMIGEIFEGAKQ